MDNIGTGTEQNNWNITSRLQLEVDGANKTVTLAVDSLVKIEVQLGNGANQLHASGGILAVTVMATPVDTGDLCIMGQVPMNVVAGDRMALISIPSFWAKTGSVIRVYAKSSNGGDSSIGGKVWVNNVAPGAASDATAIVAALMADTGFTAGGTMTYETLMKLLAAWVAGTWRNKAGSSTIKELLDADDGSVVSEITLSTTTPYKQVTIS